MSTPQSSECPWCGSTEEGAAQPGTLCPHCRVNVYGLHNLTSEQFNGLPFGVIVVDNAGTVLQYNDTEQKMSRKDPREVIGKNFFRDIAPCTEVKEFHGRFSDFLSGKNQMAEFIFTFPFPGAITKVYIIFLRRTEDETFIVVKRI